MKNYRDQQEEKVVNIRDDVFHDPGYGEYGNPPQKYEFVLSHPELNLWEGIRNEVVEYFKTYKIHWDKSKGALPTGHLLSSQVACVNHLYFLRHHPEFVTQILRRIDPDINTACSIQNTDGSDEGFVAFEKVGTKKLGKERCLTRGTNCTSIDAMMIGEKHGKRILFLIEWKYTGNYKRNSSKLGGSSGETRIKAYKELLEDRNCLIKAMHDVRPLFYEPFYQLMRQTLLGWQMVNRQEYGASDWRHLHIIP